MKTLTVKNVGPISDATVRLGDLTVLVGPQASGKSIFLQWLKLVLDIEPIKKQLSDYGADWNRDVAAFFEIYFGEGMKGTWTEGSSQIIVDRTPFDLAARIKTTSKSEKQESVFLAPAQRVLALQKGWPRPFSDYDPGDPYVVRAYSEKLRLLMNSEFGSDEALFPKINRLKSEYRGMLKNSMFSGFSLNVERFNAQKRLVLKEGARKLPYMVWSAGQREFVPLLLGLYWLMPPSRVAKRDKYDWVVLEELEMGLHPRAISTMLMLVVELLHRGYKVCLSSHSPQVLELVWAWQALKSNRGDSKSLAKILAAPNSPSVRDVLSDALKKELRVYYFDRDKKVTDISHLNPDAPESLEANWGELLSFSQRANEAVAEAVSKSHNPGLLFEEQEVAAE